MENEVLIERAKAFVQAVAAQAPWAEIEPYYAPDVSQEEFPNRLLPKGTVRNLEALREASAKGRKVIKAPIEIVNAVSSGQCVMLEAIWTGTLAVGFGTLKPDDQLRARFAQIFEFKDGLIWRQRNYDCFEAW
ncbi:MAG: nuclear transport factor 2 family protein [Methyloceanibacter sp.]